MACTRRLQNVRVGCILCVRRCLRNCFGSGRLSAIAIAAIVIGVVAFGPSHPAVDDKFLLEHLVFKLSEPDDEDANGRNREKPQNTVIHIEPFPEGFLSISALDNEGLLWDQNDTGDFLNLSPVWVRAFLDRFCEAGKSG